MSEGVKLLNLLTNVSRCQIYVVYLTCYIIASLYIQHGFIALIWFFDVYACFMFFFCTVINNII